MAAARVLLGITTTAEDDDFVVDRLTAELADELRVVGEVDYVSAPAAPGDKGVAEAVIGALSVVIAADPAYLSALVEAIVAFTNRNAGRRVRLKVGEMELTIDRPTRDEVETVIGAVQSAIERNQ